MLTKEKKIIDAVADKLPIKALAERALLPKLKETYPDIVVNLDTVLEIHSMVDLGDAGGIGCEICPLNYDRAKAKAAVVCSLTHLRIKVGEPNFDLLTDYKTKRIKKLALQNAMPWRNAPPRR
jgi:hypothetical protein